MLAGSRPVLRPGCGAWPARRARSAFLGGWGVRTAPPPPPREGVFDHERGRLQDGRLVDAGGLGAEDEGGHRVPPAGGGFGQKVVPANRQLLQTKRNIPASI